MLYRQMLELFDMLDRPQACGEEVKKLMLERGADEVTVHTVEGTDDNGKKGTTDCICILVKGKKRQIQRRHGAHHGHYRPVGRAGRPSRNDWICVRW